ncbi:uncharacterized protein LOC120665921 [Panicum virgatum]|uniref:Uncharacterized protein n=1 Tax=Panicum virgatum TaxID=38727 RepID=A0A8T0UDK2_PANVG|nr:uncharacterized protein LOC120665921 [Panicum virgatum]KAG2620168.1 hypothetical protein PVAP13_3NG169400 [Panicum virgatum]
MGMEAKCGGLAVAAGATVRRPLQQRDTNVAASTVVVAKAAPKAKAKPPKAVTRLAASPSPLLPPPPPPVVVVKPRVNAECGAAAVLTAAEVSLAEELERARERRGRLREARERTEREMDCRAEALDREVAEWERRAGEQRRLVAELMRLVGMPEAYTPVESLRSREERKRREAIGPSVSRGSTSTASTLPADVGSESCRVTKETVKTTEIAA